jgi:hypothetical protein
MITTVLGFFFAIMFVLEVCLTIYAYMKRDSLLEFIEMVIALMFMGLSTYICFTSSNWEVEMWAKVAIYVLIVAFLLVKFGQWMRNSRASLSTWTEDDIST